MRSIGKNAASEETKLEEARNHWPGSGKKSGQVRRHPASKNLSAGRRKSHPRTTLRARHGNEPSPTVPQSGNMTSRAAKRERGGLLKKLGGGKISSHPSLQRMSVKWKKGAKYPPVENNNPTAPNGRPGRRYLPEWEKSARANESGVAAANGWLN